VRDVGGQIGGEAQRLFQVYSAGNFIETACDTRHFQIREPKYGKSPDTPLAVTLQRRISAEDAYFKVIRDGRGESLRNAFQALPDPAIP
jgi:putative proteasome-type protease